MLWNAVIFGPHDTPFEDGTFKLTIEFTEEYPNKPPTVRYGRNPGWVEQQQVVECCSTSPFVRQFKLKKVAEPRLQGSSKVEVKVGSYRRNQGWVEKEKSRLCRRGEIQVG